MNEDHRTQILSEIAHEEQKIAELRGTVDDELSVRPSVADRMERAAMFVASAEETVVRSYDATDQSEREAFAMIALNLLRGANPQAQEEEDASPPIVDSDWWERDESERHGEFTASLDTISRLSIESHLRAVLRSQQVLEQEELLRRRAHRVAAFAALSARQAEGLPIGSDDLKDAAESISAGSGILPVSQTLGLIKVFVGASIASGNSPPVAVLAKPEQSPEHLLSGKHGAWSSIKPPSELAGRGYALWVEPWAEALLVHSLIPAVVFAHDDSPESNDALTHVMRESKESGLGRAVVVASTTEDLRVVARVSLSGGIFYPIRTTVEGLRATVNQAVIQAVSATPDLAISYWMPSDVHRLGPDIASAPIADFLQAVDSVIVPPSDLELAQRTLAVFDDAVSEFNTVRPELMGSESNRDRTIIYADLVRRVAERLDDLGSSRRALSVAEEALANYRRLIQFKSFPAPSRRRAELIHRRLAEIEQRHEVVDDMTWVYESLLSIPGRPDIGVNVGGRASAVVVRKGQLSRREQAVADLLAAGKTQREISKELGITRENARRLISRTVRKLTADPTVSAGQS